MPNHRVLAHALTVLAVSIIITASGLPAQDTGVLFGPEVFDRQNGKPVTENRVIDTTGFDHPFTMRVLNGDENGDYRVSSAKIWLDGKLLLGPSDFSQQVEGHVLPVILTGQSVLKIRLASSPGSYLTIWIEGQPPPDREDLDVILDGTNAVSALIPADQGGSLTAYAADGTLFSLEIPPQALFQSEQISMTPIATVSNLPFSGGFLYGVEVEPHGLMLVKPAHLTITPPFMLPPESLIGFSFQANGRMFHLYPDLPNEVSIELVTTHFSGYAVGEGTQDDVLQVLRTVTEGVEAQFLEEIEAVLHSDPDWWEAGILTDGQVALLRDIVRNWYYALVLPSLHEAIWRAEGQCDQFRPYIDQAWVDYGNWAAQLFHLKAIGFYDLIDLNEQHRWTVYYELTTLYDDWDKLCSEASEFCEKVEIYDCLVQIAEVLQLWLGDEINPYYACDGVSSQIMRSVFPIPQDTELGVHETIEVIAHLANALEELISDPLGVQSVLWSSTDDSKAVVRAAAADPLLGEVTGKGEGIVGVVAEVTQCKRTSKETVAVEVICPVASVELNPSSKQIDVDEEVDLHLVREDRHGDAYTRTDYPPDWDVQGEEYITLITGGVGGDFLGTVTGTQEGEALVIARVCEQEATANIQVQCPIRSIEIDPSSLALRVGGQGTLTVTMRDRNGQPYQGTDYLPEWHNADQDVAIVTPEGGGRTASVEALKEGSTTATTTVCGQEAQAQIEVSDSDVLTFNWTAFMSDSESWTEGFWGPGSVWITVDHEDEVNGSWNGSGTYNLESYEMVNLSSSGTFQGTLSKTVTYDCGSPIGTRTYSETFQYSVTLAGPGSEYLKAGMRPRLGPDRAYIDELWSYSLLGGVPTTYSWARNGSGASCSGPYSISDGDTVDIQGFDMFGLVGYVPATNPEGTMFSGTWSITSPTILIGGGGSSRNVYVDWSVEGSTN